MALEIGLHENQMKVYSSKARFIALNCGRRWGKAICLTTPILLSTFEWSTVGDLKPGDWIFDESGCPVKITHVSEIYYNRPCYKVVFSDGSEIVADAWHDWVTETRSCRKNRARTKNTKLKPEKITTEGIFNSLFIKRKDGKIEYNHSIDVAKPLFSEYKLFNLHPYVLGVWLGDGSQANGEFASDDPEIGNRIRDLGYPVNQWGKFGHRVMNGEKCKGQFNKWKDSSILPQLKEYNLIQNKHIPRCYFAGSIEQRLDLLRGLMDTDGTISEFGHCEFSVCNKRLALDFRELLTSLGQKSTFSSGDAKLNGRVTGTRYRIKFTPVFDPFYLSRKSKRYKNWTKPDVKRRFIVDVIPVDSVPVKCITVDNESHLFLVGRSLIATHNSWFGASKIIISALHKPYGVYWITAPTFPQTDIMWRMVLRLLPKKYIKQILLSKLCIELVNGATIWAKSTDKYDNLRGEGLDGVVLDEAAMMHPDAWFKVIRPALMDKLGWALFCTTPRGKNWYHKLYQKGVKGSSKYHKNWESFTFSSYDNPYLEREELEDIIQDLSELEFEQEILAIFLSDGGTVFKNIDSCIRSNISDQYISGRTYVMGVDLGRLQDFTVIHVCDTITKELVYRERFNKTAWAFIKSRIRSVYFQYGTPPVFLDTTGVGDAIQEDLVKDGVNVVSYKFTLESKKELVKRLSIAFHNCDIFIPDDASLREELESYTYVYTDGGNIKYGAPKGSYDDQVCALMLANYGMNGGIALCIGGFETELTQEEYDRMFEDKLNGKPLREDDDEFYNWDQGEGFEEFTDDYADESSRFDDMYFRGLRQRPPGERFVTI